VAISRRNLKVLYQLHRDSVERAFRAIPTEDFGVDTERKLLTLKATVERALQVVRSPSEDTPEGSRAVR
jgi:hypothetical protein